MDCSGWAVVDEGEISIKTVSDTRRAAIVNWLCITRVAIYTTDSDGTIEKLWRQCGGESKVCQVLVSLKEGNEINHANS